MTVRLKKNGKYIARLRLPTSERDSNNRIIRKDKTKTFKSKEAAELWEKETVREHNHSGHSNFLSAPQLSEYREAKNLGRGEDLREVVRFWLQHHPSGDVLTVRQVWEKYESSQDWNDFKGTTRENKRHGILKFCGEFGDMPIASVSQESVEKYLDTFSHPQTRNTHASTIRTMFTWAAKKKQNYLQTNQLKLLEPSKVSFAPPEIISVEDVQKLFTKTADIMPHMLPFLALQFFAGIRTNEIAQLLPKDFDLKGKSIYIRPDVAKTKGKGKEAESARLIEDLPVTLWKWLDAVGFTGEVDSTGYKERIGKIYAEAVVPHPKNVGRHCFCSYAYALLQDAGKVRKWTGHANNDVIFKRHYANVVKKSVAERYFKIHPAGRIKLSPVRKFKGATNELTDENLLKAREVMSNSQIAKAYDVTETAIRKRLKKLEISAP